MEKRKKAGGSGGKNKWEKADQGMDKKEGGTREEEEAVERKDCVVLSCVSVCVLHGMGGAGRLTYHSIISKKLLEGQFSFLICLSGGGAEPGGEKCLYFPFTPS